jgi:hypothetical protein
MNFAIREEDIVAMSHDERAKMARSCLENALADFLSRVELVHKGSTTVMEAYVRDDITTTEFQYLVINEMFRVYFGAIIGAEIAELDDRGVQKGDISVLHLFNLLGRHSKLVTGALEEAGFNASIIDGLYRDILKREDFDGET